MRFHLLLPLAVGVCCVAPPSFRSRLHARLLECVKSTAAISSDHRLHIPSFKDVMSFLPVSGSTLSLYFLNRASLSFVQHGMYDFRTPLGIYFLALLMMGLQKRW